MHRRVAILAAVAALHPAIASAQECPALSVINCGHRGTGTNDSDNPLPENTIESFEQAALEGADMVELDVQHSSDGALVVMHDDTVNRTTDGDACVGDLTLGELQQLDAGSGAAIPTLDEVLAAVDIDVNVEIKINEDAGCPASDRPQLAADVAAAIANDSKARRIIVSSFDFDVLSELEAIDDSIYIGFLTLDSREGENAVNAGFDALHLLTAGVRAEVVEDLHALGLDVNVWTENDPESMQLWMEFGVDMIITDEPDLFLGAQTAFCDNYEPPPDDNGDDGGCSVGSRSAPASGPLLLLLVFATARCRRRSSALPSA